MRWLARRGLKAKSPYTRLNAIRKLEKYGRSEVALIVGMLSEPSNRVRIGACEVLGRLKDPSAIPRLADLMLGRFDYGDLDKPVLALRTAAAALGQIGDPAAIPPLIQALEHALGPRGYEDVRAEAAVALGHFRATAAVEPLIKLASKSSGPDYVKALVALAEIGGERANAFVLEFFKRPRSRSTYKWDDDNRDGIALRIWVEAAHGHQVDKQVLSATEALAESERLRQKLPDFGRIIIT
jgi:HEAT repeat protein